jgi:hypothetical protein
MKRLIDGHSTRVVGCTLAEDDFYCTAKSSHPSLALQADADF